MRKRTPERNIAMFDVAHDPLEPFATVFGAWVVVPEAIEETIRNIAPDRIQIYSNERKLSLSGRNRSDRVDYCTLRSFVDGTPPRQIDHWHDFLAGLRPFQLRRGLGDHGCFPISINHHTVSYQEQYHNFFLKLLLDDVRPYDSLICASTAARDAIQSILTSTSDWMRDRAGGDFSFKGRLEVIPLGVRTDVFKPRDKADLRAQFRLPKDALILLWVGRLSETDKADLLPLLRVFRRLVERNKDKKLLLLIAGSEMDRGLQSDQLQDYARVLGIEDRVTIHTSVPPSYRHLIFGTADIFVSPSDNVQESFGLTPIEAMASGVPQVVSDWNGYRDTVRHGETGFLIPTRWMKCDRTIERFGSLFEANRLDHLLMAQTVVIDLDSYQEHLQLLLDRPDVRAKMARASRQRALKEYSWPVIVRRLRELWKDQERQRRSSRPRERGRGRHYTDPMFFEYFKGYAQSILTGNETVFLTDEYARVAYEGEPLPYYFGKEWGFRKEVFFSIVRVLERGTKSKGKRSISEIVARLSQSSERFDPEVVRQHLMWLLKYGYLQIKGA